jgi:hypothetical protein
MGVGSALSPTVRRSPVIGWRHRGRVVDMPNRPISGARQRTWTRLRSAPRATIATATMASLGLAGLGYAATQPTKARTATATTMTATSTTTNWTGLADQVPTPDLHWTTCQKITQCATAELPVNYHDPHDAKIKVGLLKIKAKDPAHRIGTLFVNPGGPGQAAEPTALQFAEDPSQAGALLDRFDIVGIDPRGVGASTQLQCFGRRQRRAAGSPRSSPLPSRSRQPSSAPGSAPARHSAGLALLRGGRSRRRCPPRTMPWTWTCCAAPWVTRSSRSSRSPSAPTSGNSM